MTQTQELIAQNFSHLEPKNDFPLGPITYFKVGGPAEVFLRVAPRNDIIAVITFCKKNDIRFTILGGASNVIVSDQGIRGVVIQPTNDEYFFEKEKKVVRVGAGIRTAMLVRKTVDDSMQGLEYFLGVPGRLGGAIYNNAHYFSHLIGERITRVEVIQENGDVVWLDKNVCDFAYDHSRFQQTKEVILQAEFALQSGDQTVSKELIKETTEYRARTQPLGEPSSGCYFRNAPNTEQLKKQFPQFAERSEVPAGFLIDQAGLKGERVGDVMVSYKHASFLVNAGHATSDQTLQLAQHIKDRVREKFGVELHEEVFFLE